jgi:hypothetical protein
MTFLRFSPVAAVALILATYVAGCTTTTSDGRYQTRGGGWDNFRAEAPATPVARSS